MGIDGHIAAYRLGSPSKSGMPSFAWMAAAGVDVRWHRYIVTAVATQLERGITEVPAALD
jgi:hypothetical protein